NRVGIPRAEHPRGVVRAEHRYPVEQVPSLVGRAAPNMDTARRLGLEHYLAPAERLEWIGLREKRMVPHGRHRAATVGVRRSIAILEAAQGDRWAHLERREGQRRRPKRGVGWG